MKYYSPLFLMFFLVYNSSNAQVYDEYIGLGNIQGVTITASDDHMDPIHSLDGSGIGLDIQGSSRFLAHATLGATIEEIEILTELGMEAWIDEQLEIPATQYTLPTIEIYFKFLELCTAKFGEDCPQKLNISFVLFRYAWWNKTMHDSDKLRQRITLALSEIIVTSDRSGLDIYPHALSYYYDALNTHAFGNYKDLLMDITLNPGMGFYLSHFNNPKSIPSLNIHPDENYAREIMQLFSIGLYELNLDGSRKIDPQTGLWIPTYDNNDIKGLAKVFTGLSGSKWEEPTDNSLVEFGKEFNRYSKIDNMSMFEDWHEQGDKTIVGGHTIPSGQTGMEDIEDAIEHLFQHPNLGPFIGYRLIQRLIKSNPTPAYIERISTVFNDNGAGVRGDMASVVKAILLDEEALECYWFDDITTGKLRAPMLRQTQLLKGLKAETESDEFWNTSGFFQNATNQHPVSAPSVFNFYSPDYEPNSDFSYYNFKGPEYQILNSSTSSNYVNYSMVALMGEYFNELFSLDLPNILNEPFNLPEYIDNPDYYAAHLSDPLWKKLRSNPEELIDYLDILLANGHLSDETRAYLKLTLQQNILPENYKSNYAAFLILIHPDYLIMK